jgi:hypothetical protein
MKLLAIVAHGKEFGYFRTSPDNKRFFTRLLV